MYGPIAILSPKRHFFFDFSIERRAQNSDEYHRHAEVNDVSAVTARIAVPQLHHRREQVLPGVTADDAPAANELRNHRNATSAASMAAISA